MAVVSDFVIIQGGNQRIGNGGTSLWGPTFNTYGLYANGEAFLMLMVRGLTETTRDAEVRINNQPAGHIRRNQGADPNHWFTQILKIPIALLNNGQNQLLLQAVLNSSGNYDTFDVRSVVCFFQQQA